MSVDVGSQLGAYEILALIGEGGMGRVFRARDTRLKRDVAIKALPPEFASDAERIARFRREAEALAALSHPHIAGIHDVVESSGSQFLVLEMVEGETVADRVERGPIPVDETLALAQQIAGALEAAHARGIVHRDLKPANVKITPAGVAKVLDFGLAKGSVEEAVKAGLTHSPTGIGSGTRDGVILGTAGYMSPEQARGQKVDAQSDIWAFGCTLYEMLTGQQTFAGATVTDVLAAVVRGDPDWSRLPAETPARVRALLRRCLQKDRTRRLHHIGDARIELEDRTADDAAGATTTPARVTGRPLWGWMAAGAFALTAAGLAALLLMNAGSARPSSEMRLDINTPPSSAPAYLALSPDGRALAFVASSQGVSRLWIRAFNASEPQMLAGTELASAPFWAPDSRSIGFFADGKLKRIDIAGGLTRTLTSAPIGSGGSWSRDGVIVYAPSAIGALSRVSASGGDGTPVTRLLPGQTGHRLPHFLPDGRHFLFFARGSPGSGGLFVGSLDGGDPRHVLDTDSAGMLAPTGHLLFVRQGSLYARAFDTTRLEVTGEDLPIANRIAFDADINVAALSVSPSGLIAYRTGGSTGQRQLIWVDRTGKKLDVVVPSDTTSLFNPELSPDGRYIALNRTVEPYQDVWLIEADRNLFRRFTFDPGSDQIPVWSPDGRHLFFGSNRKGSYGLYQKAVNGPDTETVLLESQQNKFPMSLTPDGRFLLFRNTGENTNWDLWVLPIDKQSAGKPYPIVQTTFQEMMGEFSPDGHWIAYQSNESGQYEIYLQSFPEPQGRIQVSTTGGSQPRWRKDGKELFYIGLDSRLMAVPLSQDPKGRLQAAVPVPLFLTRTAGGPVPIPQKQQYAVSADGQRFLLVSLTDEATSSPITLILNWTPN